jgi:radical SAM superfamily enzyme YgiQ (UPF0313 family)
MKKIVFVNPWIYDFTAYDLWAKPLGLLYLAGIIDRYVKEVKLFYIDILDRYSGDIRKKIKIPKPRIDGRGKFHREVIEKPKIYDKIPRNYSRYGFTEEIFIEKLRQIGEADIFMVASTMTYWYPGVHRAIALIKELYPKSEVWLGGIYPTLLKSFAEKESGADFVGVGRFENYLLPILKERGFKVKNNPVFNSIGELPYPLYSLEKNHPYLPFMTSFGCPYRCPYCASHILTGGFFQKKTELMYEELFFYKRKYHVEHIVFYDDALLVNKKNRLLPLLRKLREKGLSFSFHTPNGIHIRELDYETAKELKESNFKTLRLSLETGVENLVDELAPKLKLEDYEKAIFNLEKAGFKRKTMETYILFGHPEQRYEDMEKTIKFVSKYKVPVKFSYFSPIPGTPNYQKLIDKGVLKKDDDPLIQNKIAFVYLKSNLSFEEIHELKTMANNLNEIVKKS